MRIRPTTTFIFVLAVVCAAAAEPQQTLHILAFDCVQAQAEQRLADTNFSPKSGIKVVIERRSSADIMRQLDGIASTTNAQYDLVHYENPWLGALVGAGLLERLDTPAYLGTNLPPSAVTNDVAGSEILLTATNTALSLAILRPEIAYRVGKYPTRERELWQRNFEPCAKTPVYGLPWSVSAQILVYRVDLVDGAFARLEPSVAELYNKNVAPEWTNEWPAFASAARLVQLVNSNVRGVSARASTNSVLEDFLPILWSYGGDLWNEERRKSEGVLNSIKAVKALQSYCDWNLKESKIAPPESASWADAEAIKAFVDGKVAMGVFWPRLAPQLDDIKASKVAGRLGYSALPGTIDWAIAAKPGKDPNAGVTGAIDAFQAEKKTLRGTLNMSEGIAINSFSKQKRAAWQYLEWLFSRQTQLALVFEPGAHTISARTDLAAESAGAGSANRVLAEMFETGAVRSRWNIPEQTRLDAILARECNLAFSGKKNPRAALDTAAREIQAILDEGTGE